ncbi:hypothetical protein BFJ68_g167 [Fusarium oxysporum]|uniref:Uncharacterized protein n=2 Tax=Fusarium oxysporum TaxID=5507 RepID=A0A420QA81_FUSOX|nr:hypothetical protein BFJ65_g10921 [Fusarium oxysporum f. sp. cepae]RKK56165.1 hypothetical protein BFJ66_g3782 [Fusarium oxysporum f. sp. cepae]RKL01646.1 hypothetical protein BFJ71_g4973 [Fusarium oxysporum]RKL25530.1 hypothetical protein BFJ68_g167 [Fusarium oxysporum]
MSEHAALDPATLKEFIASSSAEDGASERARFAHIKLPLYRHPETPWIKPSSKPFPAPLKVSKGKLFPLVAPVFTTFKLVPTKPSRRTLRRSSNKPFSPSRNRQETVSQAAQFPRLIAKIAPGLASGRRPGSDIFASDLGKLGSPATLYNDPMVHRLRR